MDNRTNTRLTLDEFKDRHFGKKGTVVRDKLEEEYSNFKIHHLNNRIHSDKETTPFPR